MRAYILLLCLFFNQCMSMDNSDDSDNYDGTLELLPHPPPSYEFLSIKKISPRWFAPLGLILFLVGTTNNGLNMYKNFNEEITTLFIAQCVLNTVVMLGGALVGVNGCQSCNNT